MTTNRMPNGTLNAGLIERLKPIGTMKERNGIMYKLTNVNVYGKKHPVKKWVALNKSIRKTSQVHMHGGLRIIGTYNQIWNARTRNWDPVPGSRASMIYHKYNSMGMGKTYSNKPINVIWSKYEPTSTGLKPIVNGYYIWTPTNANYLKKNWIAGDNITNNQIQKQINNVIKDAKRDGKIMLGNNGNNGNNGNKGTNGNNGNNRTPRTNGTTK